MTRVGSPLWTAPEVLAGTRYDEKVDAYSLGIVLFEIAARKVPYMKRIADFKKGGGKGLNMSLMQEIALGKMSADLEAEDAFKVYGGVGRAFKMRRSSLFSAM